METLLNFVGFQLVWLACILGAANGVAWVGCAAAFVFVAFTAARSARALRAVSAFVVAGAAGSGVDALQRALDWIDYAGMPLFAVWAPAWIVALWVAFAATYASSLAWLRDRPWLSVPFAGLGAPLSYLGAERLGAVAIEAPRALSLCGIGVGWAAAFHVAAVIERRVNRVAAH